MEMLWWQAVPYNFRIPKFLTNIEFGVEAVQDTSSTTHQDGWEDVSNGEEDGVIAMYLG